MVDAKKAVAVALVAVLVANMLMFAFRVIGAGVFWVIIAFVALSVYLLFPKKEK